MSKRCSRSLKSMKKQRPERYLGLARRAGKIIPGYRTCLGALGRGRIRMILVAEDASDNTKDKFESLCSRYDVPYVSYGSTDDLSAAAGMDGISVYGITDRNIADVMIKEIGNETIVSK